MKRNILSLFILTVIGGFNIHTVDAQESTNQRTITVEPFRLVQSGEVIHIDFNIILKNVRLKTAAGLDFIPKLITPGQTLILPEISLKGPNEYLAYERTLSLMSKKQKQKYRSPYLIVKGKHWENDTLEYRYILPYEPWMADAYVEIQYDQCGCGLAEFIFTENLGHIVTTPPAEYQIIPHVAYIQPQPEDIKRREKQAECFLDFVVNKTDIRPDYMNNPRELAKIYRLIDELKNDPDVSVNRLDIIGYASPEGTLQHNKWLSERRAMALRDYLATQYDFPSSQYHIVFGGENWDGLLAALDTTDIPYKTEILNIIETVSIENGREKRLMDLRGGDPYRYMLKNIFPGLRVAICKVQYNIRNFNLDEAKEIIRKRPQNLSLNEMFLVANTYVQGSQEFVDIFETAVRMYPEDQVANLNAAASALMRNDSVSAERYLSRVKPETYPAEYNNAMGVLALLKANYGVAESYLNKAADAGLQVAKQNLEELSKKKKNSK